MLKGKSVQYLVSLAVSMAAVSGGVSLFWLTPVIPKFRNHEAGFNITEADTSWVAALASPGYMVGSLITRHISDSFGRRATILGSALPIIVGTTIILNATAAWMLCVTRFMWGIGTGMIGTSSVIYLAEISDKEIRGRLSAGNRFMQTFGGFLVMVAGAFVSFHVLNYMQLVLPISFFVACCFVPESPYYFLKKGKVDDARKALIRLSGNTDQEALERRLSAMRSHVRSEMARSGSFKELVTGKQYRKAMIIVIGLKVTQMLAGSLALQQYLGAITQESNIDIALSTALIIFASVRLVVGVCSSILVDKVGRRPLLFHSYLYAGIILGIVGTYYFIRPASSVYGLIPLIGITMFVALTTVGYNTVGYVVLGEVFPINVKSVAVTFVNIFGGLLSFLSVKCYQEIKDISGLTGVFWFYAIWALIGAAFTYFFVPETKGKSLREIQIELQGKYMIEEGHDKLNQIVNEKGVTTELTPLKDPLKAPLKA